MMGKNINVAEELISLASAKSLGDEEFLRVILIEKTCPILLCDV